MAINYNVDKNKLTSPPSYYPRVAPIEVLDDQALASQINLHNPNIPVGTALMMISVMTEEIKRQLIAGNWVKIPSFCSFSSSITDAVMSSPDDDLPAGFKIKLNFKPSAPFVTDVRVNASLSKTGYIDKTPKIVSERNQAINVANVWAGYVPMLISGTDLRFDQTASDEGVFLTVDGGSETRLTSVALNEPSRVIVIPNLVEYTTLQGSVAARLSIRTRYTENGTLRSIDYDRNIRGANRMLTTESNVPVFKPYGSSAFMDLSAAATSNALYTLEKKNTGEIVIYRQVVTNNIVGTPSAEVIITSNGAYVVDTDYTFTVSDFSALEAWIQTEGNYVQEQIVVS